jgi:putative methyltransferase (TIGR04325 family)
MLPPLLLSAARRWSGRSLRFRNAGPDWASACERSRGYDDSAIVDRVAAATREVIAGRAAFERDSVTFAHPDFRYPALAALMHNAALHQGNLQVVDVGGALGSTYWQVRPFLRGLASVRWVVVEQAAFAELGRREFGSGELLFAGSLEEEIQRRSGNIAVLSSVLQYLEQPQEMLASLARLPATHMLIDRTPLHDGTDHHLTIQQVPAHIYDASYPCWILSRPRLMETLGRHWTVLADFGSEEGQASTDDGLGFEFRGLYLERRQ